MKWSSFRSVVILLLLNFQCHATLLYHEVLDLNSMGQCARAQDDTQSPPLIFPGSLCDIILRWSPAMVWFVYNWPPIVHWQNFYVRFHSNQRCSSSCTAQRDMWVGLGWKLADRTLSEEVLMSSKSRALTLGSLMALESNTTTRVLVQAGI